MSLALAYGHQITQHFQRLQGQTQYRDVEALDSDLKRFVADLPPQFRMLVPDKSYDEGQSPFMQSILAEFDQRFGIYRYIGIISKPRSCISQLFST